MSWLALVPTLLAILKGVLNAWNQRATLEELERAKINALQKADLARRIKNAEIEEHIRRVNARLDAADRRMRKAHGDGWIDESDPFLRD